VTTSPDDFFKHEVAKFPLLTTSKLPACKWTDKGNHQYGNALEKNKNHGIITGNLNNLLVLDIDVKDNGLEEWNKFIERNGEPQTVTISTPSGGLHYYFLYSSKNESNEQLLREHLYTQTKLRGVGIDIRSDGGYIVAPHSVLNNKKYTYVNNSDKNNLMEMPTGLILWLIEGKNKDKDKPATTVQKTISTIPKKCNSNDNIVYMISDEKLQDILDMVPKEYCDNYLKWLSVTNVLKGLDRQEIWTSLVRKVVNTTKRTI
jgi:hypothetical protein